MTVTLYVAPVFPVCSYPINPPVCVVPVTLPSAYELFISRLVADP